MRVENFHNKNQFLIYDDDLNVVFQSYSSECAKLTRSGVLLFGEAWDYSATTRKHLYLFLRECVLPNLSINPFTHKSLEIALTSRNKRQALEDLLAKGVILSL